MIPNYHQFAQWVAQLRKVQKADGSGYKSPADRSKAQPLEKKVDDALAEIEKHFPGGTAGAKWGGQARPQ
jgi:hypothetical protein